MRLFTAVLWLVLLQAITPAEASEASVAMKKLCTTVGQLGTCKTSIGVPSAKIKLGKINWVKWNGCKSKIHYGFGWTCLGGYDKTQITAPVGIEFSQVQVDLCKLARKTMPGIDQMVSKSKAICLCLPDVSKWLYSSQIRA
jgi:hypothetical protein